MNVLVTGGTGFIGSQFVEKLLKQKDKVWVFSRNEGIIDSYQKRGIEVIVGNLKDKASLNQVPLELDYVYHLAATRDSSGEKECYASNVGGIKNLLETIHEKRIQLKKFVLISSLGAAGFSKGETPKKEDDPLAPTSLYGKTKMLAEQELMKFKGRIPYIILRPCKVYGPGDKRILMHFKFIKYGIVPDFGIKKRVISLCYVDDLINAMLMSAKAPNTDGIYFISDGNVYSWEKFYSVIASVMNRKLRTIFIPEIFRNAMFNVLQFIAKAPQKIVPIEPNTINEIRSENWSCDSTKLSKELGYKSSMDIETGLRNTSEWFLEKGLI